MLKSRTNTRNRKEYVSKASGGHQVCVTFPWNLHNMHHLKCETNTLFSILKLRIETPYQKKKKNNINQTSLSALWILFGLINSCSIPKLQKGEVCTCERNLNFQNCYLHSYLPRSCIIMDTTIQMRKTY